MKGKTTKAEYLYLALSYKKLNFFKMTKEQVLGVIRHVLTFAGGFLVTKGLVDEGVVMEVVGAVTTIIGSVWSIVAKKNA